MSLPGFSPANSYVLVVQDPAAGGLAGGIRVGSRPDCALVIGLPMRMRVLWTMILTKLKAAQDIHIDIAEAYAWGQKFQLGYGKHPPLSGWVAGALVRCCSRSTNWAAYALAMATVGCRAGDLLADRAARGRPAPRVLRRGDARALSDLQFQGFQIQSGSAAARDAAARGAGLSAMRSRSEPCAPGCGSGWPVRWR